MVNKIIYRITGVLFVVSASSIFIQCDNRPDDENQEVESDSSTAYLNNQNTSYIREREELVSNLENLKNQIDGRIENLDSQIEESDEADESWVSMRDELKEDRSKVQSAIESLHNSTQNTWNNLKSETENLYERVSSKLNRWNNTLQNRSSE